MHILRHTMEAHKPAAMLLVLFPTCVLVSQLAEYCNIVSVYVLCEALHVCQRPPGPVC
jgi:hypothetical protein